MKPLLIISVEHSGSCFVRDLLGKHYAITEPRTTKDFYTSSPKAEQLLYKPGVVDYITFDRLFDIMIESAESYHRYAQLNIYVQDNHLAINVFEGQFKGKVIITIRDPASVLKSLYYRGEESAPVMSRYRALLLARKIYPDSFLFPVDIVSTKNYVGRMNFIASLFGNFLGIEVTNSIATATRLWRKVNYTKKRMQVLSAGQKDDIRRRIRRADIYRALDGAGIDFYSYDHEGLL
jgi:hypothetical protein